MKKFKERDNYYNTLDVFMPKAYRNEMPEYDDLCKVELDSPFLLIHPRWLDKRYRTKQYQLVQLIWIHSPDSNERIYIDIRLASNGCYAQVPLYYIMAIAHTDDIRTWKSLYGKVWWEQNEDNDEEYDLYDNLNDAIKDIHFIGD